MFPYVRIYICIYNMIYYRHRKETQNKKEEVTMSIKTVKLVGSEKQVKWAEDIRKEIVEIYEESKKAFIKSTTEKGKWEKNHEKYETAMKVIEESSIFNNESAKFYIENFGYAGSKEYVIREMAQAICEEKGAHILFARKIGMY